MTCGRRWFQLTAVMWGLLLITHVVSAQSRCLLETASEIGSVLRSANWSPTPPESISISERISRIDAIVPLSRADSALQSCIIAELMKRRGDLRAVRYYEQAIAL